MKLLILARCLATALAAGVALMLAATAPAEELPFGQPKVAYSGTTVTEVGGQTMETRVFFTPGHQRNELQTTVGEEVMLLDFEKHVSYLLMPMARRYMEMPMGAHGMGGDTAKADPAGTTEHETMGRETIDGQETTKYRIETTSSEGSTSGFVWVTDDGILMRSEMVITPANTSQPPGRIVMTLQNLAIGPQDPSLFVLPADYVKMGTN